MGLSTGPAFNNRRFSHHRLSLGLPHRNGGRAIRAWRRARGSLKRDRAQCVERPACFWLVRRFPAAIVGHRARTVRE
jgi:hypothetical protein